MKIVQINTVYGTGSTGKIAADLYHIANNQNHNSFIAYGRRTAPEDIHGFKIGNPLDFGCHVLVNFFLGKSGFGSRQVTYRFLKWLDTVQPDILHLHNLHGFYIHVGILFDYIKTNNIPVVWTFHDCWPMTGQCAFFDQVNCCKWKTECSDCPVYRSDYPYSLFKDNSRQNYILKKSSFTGVKNLTIVTPSNWLADIARQSFLKEYPIIVIPNGIDLNILKPYPIDAATSNKKIVLGVANVWDSRKGLDYFLKLTELLDSSYQVVLIGISKKQQKLLQKTYGSRVMALTRTANQTELAKWYSCAHAYVNPTLSDNFPTTNLEALACGTPVITFNTGGSPESITPKCGIVVEKGNVIALKNAVLSLQKNKEITSLACRERAMEFDKNTRFEEYIKLYEKAARQQCP